MKTSKNRFDIIPSFDAPDVAGSERMIESAPAAICQQLGIPPELFDKAQARRTATETATQVGDSTMSVPLSEVVGDNAMSRARAIGRDAGASIVVSRNDVERDVYGVLNDQGYCAPLRSWREAARIQPASFEADGGLPAKEEYPAGIIVSTSRPQSKPAPAVEPDATRRIKL
jgi:hypothetical protein